jgi:hypothetical protein
MSTMKSTRPIAWSIFWKFFVSSFPAGLAIGFVFGFIISLVGKLAGVPQNITMSISQIGGFVLGAVASFLLFNFFLARAIGKQIGDKRLELVDSSAFEERT